MKRHKQIDKKYNLFDVNKDFTWEKEWQNMPEYSNNDLEPYQTIKIHFESQEDVENFSKLIGQQITIKTRFVWFPKQDKHRYYSKIYKDES